MGASHYRVEIVSSAAQELEQIRAFEGRQIVRAIWDLAHGAERSERIGSCAFFALS